MKCWTWGLKLLKPIFNDLYLDKMKFIENPLRVQCTFSFLSSATFVPLHSLNHVQVNYSYTES